MNGFALPLALLFGGLATGLHCAGMCGGISAGFSLLQKQDLWQQLAFNAGRIASYAAAGAAAGALGSAGACAAAVLPAQTLLYLLSSIFVALAGVHLAFALPLSKLERIGLPLWRRVQPLANRLLPARTLPQATRRRPGVGLAAVRTGLRRAARRGVRRRRRARRARHGGLRRRHAALAARRRRSRGTFAAVARAARPAPRGRNRARRPRRLGPRPWRRANPACLSRRAAYERSDFDPEKRAPLDLRRAARAQGARAHGARCHRAAALPGAAQHGALHRRVSREAAPPEEDEHLFARLLARAPDARLLVEALQAEHEEGAR